MGSGHMTEVSGRSHGMAHAPIRDGKIPPGLLIQVGTKPFADCKLASCELQNRPHATVSASFRFRDPSCISWWFMKLAWR